MSAPESTAGFAVSRAEFLKLAALGGAGLALAGIAGGVHPNMVFAAGKDSVVITHLGDPKGWCPDTTADDYAYAPEQNMFHRLTKLDVGKKAIPDAAESWDISDDAMTITFHLRQDLKWSDGEPLTSADAQYTFQTLKDTPEYYLCSSLQAIDTIEAPDDYTLVFNMKQPDMSLINNIGWYGGFILPKHIYDNGVGWVDNEAAKLTGTPVTSGPYKLKEYKQGQSITLEANEEYYQVPKIKTLIYSIIADPSTQVQAIQNAETDVLETIPEANVPTLQGDPSLRLVENIYPSPIRLIFNCTRSERHLDDPAVRTALAMCIDRDAISKKAFGGIRPPETHFYPSLYADYSNDKDVAPAYDPEGAQKLLEQAGYTKNENGNYIEGLTIDAFSQAGCDETAKLLASSWSSAGLQCEVVMSEFNAWNDKVAVQHDFDIEMQGGFMGPDAYALKFRLGTGTASNYGGYSSEEFDKLLDEANATPDDAKRQDLYKQAQTILSQDVPYVPLVGFTGYDAYAAELKNIPADGVDKWGWQEWTYAEWA